MHIHSSLILPATVLAMTFPAVATAADYDPPIYVEQAPEHVPVEIGSGWYLRGDVGYSFGDPVYDFTLLGESVEHRRIGGGIGFGYHFTDLLRADLTVNYHGGDRFSYNDGIDSGSASHTIWSGFASGYVDLATVAGFTPYVGAGAGLTYSRHEVSINSPTLGVTGFEYTDRQYNFAYTLMAGASYRFSDNASVDVGYQFIHTPGMEYLNTDTLSVEEGTKQHLIKVGLRYDLW